MCTTTYLSQRDLAVLTRLVRSRMGHLHHADPQYADPAVRRLAAVAGSSALLPGCGDAAPRVSLGASVRYRVAGCGDGVHRRLPDGADTDAVIIACPQDAHAMLPRISVLTPLAIGLLGHAEGCTVEIDLAFGRSLRLEIVEVRPPCDEAGTAGTSAPQGHIMQAEKCNETE